MVESWLADVDSTEMPWVRVFGDINYRILAIGLDLACERYEAAADAAEALMEEAVARRRWSEVVMVSARWAVALHHLGREEQARVVLRSALDRGARGGFVRAFYVPGFDTLTKFADVWSEQLEYQPVRRELRDILGADKHGDTAAISKRELEVLRLVAEGRTNQQIAAAMFISTNTVRNHLVRAGQRLHAKNRQEAVARARELGLLE
jgi:DNA-binding CsgD family transcriptional regulator